MNDDKQTAKAFANSWNNLPIESVYTKEQIDDWFAPLTQDDIRGKSVLELGCGNASLMRHILDWSPSRITGVDLGDSVVSARRNLNNSGHENWEVLKDDLTKFNSPGFDLVYSIGVLHHLKNPDVGFRSVINNTKPGGSFHCWVYGYEGNVVIRYFLDPIRIVASRLPWWVNKYLIALPLVLPYYLYAKILSFIANLSNAKILEYLPLYQYSLWISRRKFNFFRHVAFDQLVTPTTKYIKKEQIIQWLDDSELCEKSSIYILQRNGNSWKFGGKRKL